MAVEKLSQRSFDLILCDVRMPVMNGVEVFSWLAEHQPERLPNFVFITGHAGSDATAAAVAASSRPVITKPFTADMLCEKISTLPLFHP